MFAEFSGIPQHVKSWLAKKKIWYKVPSTVSTFSSPVRFPRRIKPFDCSLCLSFWICLYLSHYKAGQPIMESVGLACISAVLSVLIVKVTKP